MISKAIRLGSGAGMLLLLGASAQAQEPRAETDVITFNRHASGPIAFQARDAAGPGLSHTVEFISTEMGVSGKIVKEAPYSAEALTETTQTLVDGNRISRRSSSLLYRDGEGRTRRELTLSGIGPWASNEAPKIVFIHDPVAGVSYTLNDKEQTARKMTGNGVFMSFSTSSREPFEVALPAPGERGTVERKIVREKVLQDKIVIAGSAGRKAVAGAPPSPEIEELKALPPIAGVAGVRVPGPHAAGGKEESLGKRDFGGVMAEGTRVTHTIPAGEIGNDRPIEIVSERWYSPDLQTVVMSRQSDPRVGETTYKLTNIRRAEPARQLFEVPSNYTISTEEPPDFLRKLRAPNKQ